MHIPTTTILIDKSNTTNEVDSSPRNVRSQLKTASIKTNIVNLNSGNKLVERVRSRSSTKDNYSSLRNNIINGVSDFNNIEDESEGDNINNQYGSHKINSKKALSKERSPHKAYRVKTEEAINEREEDSLDTIPLNDDKSVFDHSFNDDFRDLLTSKNSKSINGVNGGSGGSGVGLSKFIKSGKNVDSIYNFNNESDSSAPLQIPHPAIRENSNNNIQLQIHTTTIEDILKRVKDDLLKSYRHDPTKRLKFEEYFHKAVKSPVFSDVKNLQLFTYFINPTTDDFIIFTSSQLNIASGSSYHSHLEKNKTITSVVYYGNGDYYEGEIFNEKREGFGLFLYKNGTKYEGMFKANKQTGYGKLFQLDGEVYIGEWRDGRINGNGIRYHANGDKYTGQYVNNIRNGSGTYVFGNGDRYEGDWVNGKANGKGKFIYSNGNWGLGIGDWGLGIGPNPQSPIPNPQSPIPNPQHSILLIINFISKIKIYIKRWKAQTQV